MAERVAFLIYLSNETILELCISSLVENCPLPFKDSTLMGLFTSHNVLLHTLRLLIQCISKEELEFLSQNCQNPSFLRTFLYHLDKFEKYLSSLRFFTDQDIAKLPTKKNYEYTLMWVAKYWYEMYLNLSALQMTNEKWFNFDIFEV